MKKLPRFAQIYISLLFLFGAIIAVGSLAALASEPIFLGAAVAVAILISVLDLFPVRLSAGQSNTGVEFTVSSAIRIAAILLAPPPLVILATFLGTFLAELRLKRVWFKLIFNVGAMTLNYMLVAVLYTAVHQPAVPLFGSVQNVLALVVLSVSSLFINSFLVSMVIALATKTPIRYVWGQTFKPLLLNDLSMLPIGVFIYILWQYSPLSIVLVALPLFVMRYSYKVVADLRKQTREALYALARILDERDEQTSQHSELVAGYAAMIARQLGLGPEEVEMIHRAGALHDIGKVGMRNSILFKPGVLTDEERESAKRHAQIGGELLEKFPQFQKGAVYVRHHHERWDGKGYPDGLSGEAIPLGARILSVADAYQAMIEERPYRKSLTQEEAYAQLRANAGTQFDPEVVQAFLDAQKVQSVESKPSVTHTTQSQATAT